VQRSSSPLSSSSLSFCAGIKKKKKKTTKKRLRQRQSQTTGITECSLVHAGFSENVLAQQLSQTLGL
jgi:hypothetical protein